MKMSEVQVSDIKQYANIFFDDDDNMLSTILQAGKVFISNYIGIPLTSDDPLVDCCDNHEDLTIALFVLCNEMYDVRNFTVEASKINFVIKSILEIYAVNLL
jgi:hypothetical protein